MKAMKAKHGTDESLPLGEWHRRFPNEYILYEGLNYTDTAEITKSRLIAHGPDREPLIEAQEKYRSDHPGACLGIEWTGPVVPEGWILML